MDLDQAYIVCPHIVEHPPKDEGRPPTSRLCGIKPDGTGRRTVVPIPFSLLDGEDFIITCPSCGNDVGVKVRVKSDEPEDDEPVSGAA